MILLACSNAFGREAATVRQDPDTKICTRSTTNFPQDTDQVAGKVPLWEEAIASGKTLVVCAGRDRVVLSGEFVELIGHVRGPGHKNVQWQQISGKTVELKTSPPYRLSFIAPVVNSPETLIFALTAGEDDTQVDVDALGSSSMTDQVSVQVNPEVGASVVIQWNALALALIKRSERGPTISGRFAALMSTALFSAWAAFDSQARGWLVDADFAGCCLDASTTATLQEYAMAAAAYAIFQEFAAGNTTILRQRHLEINTGEDAELFRRDLLREAEALLNAATEKAEHRLVDENRQALIEQVAARANELAEEILLFAASDGAQAANDYAPTMLTYETDPWALPRPQRVQRNKINFYNQNEYIDPDGVLYPKYTFPEFDPVTAAQRVGAIWDENGRLILSAPEHMVVNPAVQDGSVTLTSSWQSLTEWGIFPSTDDGGSQVPLTPHWGDVIPFVLPHGQYLRPDSVLTPYDSQGELNQRFIEETFQVVEFARTMIDGAEGGAQQRAQSEYWELGDNTQYPPGWWLDAALALIVRADCDLKTALTLTMSLNQAVFDAGVASWDSKYHFNTVRPFTVINQVFFGSTVPSFKGSVLAGTDDRDVWFPYQLRRNFTPPFPDIPSGHSSFSYAASTVMKEVFASNRFDFESEDFASRFDTTDGFNGDPTDGNELTRLNWQYFSLAAEEAGMSRLYGGIHMQEGNWLGLKYGIQIGHAALLKVHALMRGEGARAPNGSAIWFGRSPKFVFGTMSEDDLTDAEVMKDRGEMYGFFGNDTLTTGSTLLAASIEMFGGYGQDKFVLNGDAELAIRDYEPGETITIGSGAWDDNRLQPLSVAHPNENTTQLMLGETTVVTLDGYWRLDELNIRGI